MVQCAVGAMQAIWHSELDADAQVILPLLIFTFGPISGAHFNPMVTSVFVATKRMVGSSLTHLLNTFSSTISRTLPMGFHHALWLHSE